MCPSLTSKCVLRNFWYLKIYWIILTIERWQKEKWHKCNIQIYGTVREIKVKSIFGIMRTISVNFFRKCVHSIISEIGKTTFPEIMYLKTDEILIIRWRKTSEIYICKPHCTLPYIFKLHSRIYCRIPPPPFWKKEFDNFTSNYDWLNINSMEKNKTKFKLIDKHVHVNETRNKIHVAKKKKDYVHVSYHYSENQRKSTT